MLMKLQSNNSNAADGSEQLMLSSRLLAAADLSRHIAKSFLYYKIG